MGRYERGLLLRLPQISRDTRFTLEHAGAYVGDLITPTLRLGVTGLSRAGKTVFITALVKCLCEGGANPPFARLSGIEGLRAYLEPQPDDDVPRFQYEDHLNALQSEPPHWPQSTRRISELRLTLEWPSRGGLFEFLGLSQRLHIDIVDYPGEWLIDLALLDQSYQEWSQHALYTVQRPVFSALAKPFLEFLSTVDPEGVADEQVAIRGAELYTQFLQSARNSGTPYAGLGPGRFLLPGDLEGSPQLTFFPTKTEGGAVESESLLALLERRFASYRKNIVKPFFEAHFSRIDRQIVLVDVLSALNGGAEGLRALEDGLEGVMRAIRPRSESWLAYILGRRIDRIAFAATKADHVHRNAHRQLEDILSKSVSRAAKRAEAAGSAFQCIALAALQATTDVHKDIQGEHLFGVRGIPEAGERIGGRTFDGSRGAVVFPGDLPEDALDAFDEDRARPEHFGFVKFRPPTLERREAGAQVNAWPHIGLDKAFAFLFEDHLP